MLFYSNPSLDKIRNYFNFVMIAIYLSLGLLFLFTDIGIVTFPVYRQPIGITMIIYSVVRIILTLQKIRRQKNEIPD